MDALKHSIVKYNTPGIRSLSFFVHLSAEIQAKKEGEAINQSLIFSTLKRSPQKRVLMQWYPSFNIGFTMEAWNAQ